MKGLRSIFINLSLVLLIVGIFPSLVFANTAQDVHEAKGNKETTMEFVKKAKDALDKATSDRMSAINNVARFRNETRTDKTGKWKYEKTYLIQIEGNGAVLNHAKYVELYGEFINGFETVQELIDKLKEPNNDDVVCTKNEVGDAYSCAAYYNSPFNPTIQNIIIGGFDHEKTDTIKNLNCNVEPAPKITATELQKKQDDKVGEDDLKEDLKTFVEEAIRWVESVPGLGMPEGQNPNILSSVRCFTKDRSPWKDGSIYFFVMTNDSPPVVTVNGINQNLTGGPFDGVLDGNFKDVGAAILAAAQDEGGGFVDYLWDDPTDDEDDIPMSECDTPSGRCAPGNSPKLSYVKGTKFDQFIGTPNENTVFIFGSGIYPQDMKAEESSTSSGSDDDDDGCAIAAGSGNNAESTLFNLLLMVSGLFLAVSWRKRSVRKA